MAKRLIWNVLTILGSLLLWSCTDLDTQSKASEHSKTPPRQEERYKAFPGRTGSLLGWDEGRKLIVSGEVKSATTTHLYGLLLTKHDGSTCQSDYPTMKDVSEAIGLANAKGFTVVGGKE